MAQLYNKLDDLRQQVGRSHQLSGICILTREPR
jgi:hypothetical protein